MNGRNLQKLRREKGMTQWELSKAVGITTGRMLLIERGEAVPSDKLVTALAKALDVSKEELEK